MDYQQIIRQVQSAFDAFMRSGSASDFFFQLMVGAWALTFLRCLFLGVRERDIGS